MKSCNGTLQSNVVGVRPINEDNKFVADSNVSVFVRFKDPKDKTKPLQYDAIHLPTLFFDYDHSSTTKIETSITADLHGTIFVACDKLTTGLRHDLRLSQRFKTCFKMLRHFF